MILCVKEMEYKRWGDGKGVSQGMTIKEEKRRDAGGGNNESWWEARKGTRGGIKGGGAQDEIRVFREEANPGISGNEDERLGIRDKGWGARWGDQGIKAGREEAWPWEANVHSLRVGLTFSESEESTIESLIVEMREHNKTAQWECLVLSPRGQFYD